LLAIGFAVLERLNFKESIRQFTIVTVAMLISLLIPAIIAKWHFLRRISWVYAIVGIVPLLIVLIRSRIVFGAKITLDLGFFSIQPSEFVKVIFVFFVAAILSKRPGFRTVAVTTVIAAVYVVVLVLSTDLGAALLFFITYLVMLYVASGKAIYGLAGLAAGGAGGFIGAKLFPHVQNRILAWKSPFEHYQTIGNQVANSLIAVAAGGWLGVGLGRGYPMLVPLADKDFTFAAIVEELGGVFGICLILVYMSCFVMFINISVQIKHRFYKLVALGLSSIYGFQVFLTVGGAIKLIPSTGVTLPLISYGGSSILMMIILFAIIQGIYVLKLEGEEDDYAALNTYTTLDEDEETF
ncbi:MAG: FtsW/RodA/SpoVE family cell cycle protein, partial [Lachnospiraceae bacterium]|nr:FtsW/RodA/SpoVE family cell cycle protein [Lachnospiraceae bacterium]